MCQWAFGISKHNILAACILHIHTVPIPRGCCWDYFIVQKKMKEWEFACIKRKTEHQRDSCLSFFPLNHFPLAAKSQPYPILKNATAIHNGTGIHPLIVPVKNTLAIVCIGMLFNYDIKYFAFSPVIFGGHTQCSFGVVENKY